MTELYGRTYTRRELEARTGRIEQIGGVRRMALTEGLETGSELIQVRTGGGLTYYVTPGRALDISLATLGGVPLSWQSANGDVHPAYYDPAGNEWLRTAAGGLLMTCGLTYVGAAGVDQGQAFGLHGRAHHLPARHVVAEGRWSGDEYQMRVAGIVEENIVFGENLRLTREITSTLGRNRITIVDSVENIGFNPAPHMLLYHFNFGFPLLDLDTEVTFPSHEVIARDEGISTAGYERWQSPEPGFYEWVYFHEVDRQVPEVQARVHNPRFPLPGKEQPVTATLTWRPSELPRLVQWKMPGAGEHVLGIEPANCLVLGRAAEREQGTLVILEPGEIRHYHLQVDVHIGAEAKP